MCGVPFKDVAEVWIRGQHIEPCFLYAKRGEIPLEELVILPVYSYKRVVCGVLARTDKQVSQAMVLRSVTSERSFPSIGRNAYEPWRRGEAFFAVIVLVNLFLSSFS
jgi:hypothetical protein